jgi:hypothetical protein
MATRVAVPLALCQPGLPVPVKGKTVRATLVAMPSDKDPDVVDRARLPEPRKPSHAVRDPTAPTAPTARRETSGPSTRGDRPSTPQHCPRNLLDPLPSLAISSTPPTHLPLSHRPPRGRRHRSARQRAIPTARDAIPSHDRSRCTHTHTHQTLSSLISTDIPLAPPPSLRSAASLERDASHRAIARPPTHAEPC